MAAILKADQKIFRFYVPVEVVFVVKVFKSIDLYKIVFTIWSPIIMVVFRLNLFPQIINRSLRVGPSNSVTI